MKYLAIASLLFLSLYSTHASTAQTRPRRVVQSEPNKSQSPPPDQTTTQDPVLSGGTQPAIPEEISEGEVLRVNTTLVTVPVTVMDRNGRYVADFIKEDFLLFENGVEQEVAYFAAVETPFTVVLMLDTSASTWSKLKQIKDAAIAFVDELRPEDKVMVVSFASGLTIKCDVTDNRKKIRDAIQGTGRGMSTHLYDAMDKLMEKHLNRIPGRKAVVLFTDGVDATSNDATYESTTRTAEELDALIYPILYDTYDPNSDHGGSSAPPRWPGIWKKLPFPFPVPIPTQGGGNTGGGAGSSRADYDRGERYLHTLATLTGGRVYEASRDLRYLRAAFSSIAEELRRQYSLGYYPNRSARSGERLRIKVQVKRSDVVVRARDSYIYQPATTAVAAPSDKSHGNDPSASAPVLKKPFIIKTADNRSPFTVSN
jgi:Ca-activated chloride channel family protein